MRGDLHRTVTKITIDLHRKIDARRHRERRSGWWEREQQHQFPFAGQLGNLPCETTFKVLFDIMFAQDAGVARDSQLGEPHVRVSHRLLSGPTGTILYAHVPSWIYDDDFNFIGAYVTLGAFCPAIQYSQQVETVEFTGMFHLAFQGWGAPIDPEGDGPDGGFPYGVEAG
jgi:hypothetical protein